MGVIDCASSASLWRGYDYHKANMVQSITQTGDTTYTATVKGSGTNLYTVEMDITHPRKSKCNCPFADGKRIICKHIIASYFEVFPKEAERIYNEAIKYEEDEDERLAELEEKLISYIGKMKKDDLAQALLELLFDGPEWQYERFIKEHFIDF